MWKKVQKNDGKGAPGTPPRQTFAVMRYRSSGNAQLVIPSWAHNGAGRASIYEDGNRLAFVFGERGEYVVRKAGASSRSAYVSIPAKFGKALRYGTTDVGFVMDGDMFVVDLSPLMIRVAAE